MNHHVANLCKACFFHIRALCHIRPAINDDTGKTSASSFVSCRLDYTNSALYGTSLTNIKRLQRVQNGLARVVARLPTRSPTTPTLKEMHWLPIRHRIDYKIATLTYKVLDCGEPTYLHSRISFCVPCRELDSSADTRRLNTLRTKIVIAGRAFRSSAAVWNALPLDVRSVPCIATSRKKLKTFYFGCAFG